MRSSNTALATRMQAAVVSRSAQGDHELQKTKSALLEAVQCTGRGIFGIPVGVIPLRLWPDRCQHFADTKCQQCHAVQSLFV